MNTTPDITNRSTRRARRPIAIAAAGLMSLAALTGLAACGGDDEGVVDDDVQNEVEDVGDEGEELVEDTGDAIEEDTDDMTDEEDDGATE